MSAWVLSYWRSKKIFHWIDLFFLILVPIAGGFASAIDPPAKYYAVGIGVVFTAICGGAKYRAKSLEDTEKAVKDAATKAREEEREKALAILRAEYGDQAKRMAKAILVHMHEHFFGSIDNKEDKHKHRVTLFACAPDNDGVSKSLIVFARKGANSDSTSKWPVVEDEPERCRGMAGRIWCHGILDELATDIDWDSNDPVKQATYANDLKITVAEATSLRIKSKFYLGTIVMARGQKWGVLLIDSMIKIRRSDAQAWITRENKRLARYAEILGAMIAEMKQ